MNVQINKLSQSINYHNSEHHKITIEIENETLSTPSQCAPPLTGQNAESRLVNEVP